MQVKNNIPISYNMIVPDCEYAPINTWGQSVVAGRLTDIMRPMEVSPATRLSVSIVLFNSPLDLLRRNLQSLLLAARYARESVGRLRVVVDLVDNSIDPDYSGR